MYTGEISRVNILINNIDVHRFVNPINTNSNITAML